MRLRQLHANRPAADDHQMLGPRAQRKNRLIGEIGHKLQPRYRRHQRLRPGGDDKPPRGNDVAACLQFGRRGKPPPGPDHPHPQSFEPFLTVHRRNRGNHPRHMILHRAKIDHRHHRQHAKSRTVAHRLRCLGRRQQSLRRHAAGVQAIAAHRGPFHQHDPRPHLHRPRRHRQAARPRADHTDICHDPRHVRPCHARTVSRSAATPPAPPAPTAAGRISA